MSYNIFMMLITTNTTADQVPRVDICKAYQFLETLEPHLSISTCLRTRGGAITRIEFSIPVQRRAQVLVDLPALDNNSALAYLWRHEAKSDVDQANIQCRVKSILEEFEEDFGSHRAIKLRALQEAIS